MSTYLQLCQEVARESGTLDGVVPSAVTSQTGRLAKVVYWTNQAWQDIQNMYANWRWMQAEFTGSLTSSTARYTAASFSITDFADWVVDNRHESYFPLSLYDTSIGVADEGHLEQISWPAWRTMYGRGTQTENRPNYYAISPGLQLCFGATPDMAYTVNGEYRTTVQTLSADDDTPNMPARFHRAVSLRGLVMLHEHDEAPVQNIAGVRLQLAEIMSALRRDQLPIVSANPSPLA